MGPEVLNIIIIIIIIIILPSRLANPRSPVRVNLAELSHPEAVSRVTSHNQLGRLHR